VLRVVSVCVAAAGRLKSTIQKSMGKIESVLFVAPDWYRTSGRCGWASP
jgi:hypothetical protein